MSEHQKLFKKCKKSEEFTIFMSILTLFSEQYSDDLVDAILDELISKIFVYALLDTDIDADEFEKTIIFFDHWVKHTMRAVLATWGLVKPTRQSSISLCGTAFFVIVQHLCNIKQIIEVYLK